MLGSDPGISANWALSARLTEAAFPPQAYAPPRGDKEQPWTGRRRSHQSPARRSRPLGPVRSSLSARARCGSRSIVTGPVPSAQQPAAAGRLNSGSSPGTDEQLRSLIADAMRQLPFEHRAVIYRAHSRGWTTNRIADDLKITEAAVKSRLHDGLWTVRHTLHEWGCGIQAQPN